MLKDSPPTQIEGRKWSRSHSNSGKLKTIPCVWIWSLPLPCSRRWFFCSWKPTALLHLFLGQRPFAKNRGGKERTSSETAALRPVSRQMGIMGLVGFQQSPASARMSVSTWSCSSLVFELSGPSTWQLSHLRCDYEGAAIRQVGGRQRL